MAKQAKRRAATPAEAARWRKAAAEEAPHREATLAQAREMREAGRLARGVLEQLRAERERQGLSLADLRDRTGMSREAINRLENHTGPNPTMQTLVRLAAALGVRLDVRLKRAH
jgi:ribosome-binding protein aMBF1 (putative translation factor)